MNTLGIHLTIVDETRIFCSYVSSIGLINTSWIGVRFPIAVKALGRNIRLIFLWVNTRPNFSSILSAGTIVWLIARLRIRVIIIRLAGIVIPTLINRSTVGICELLPWILLQNGLSNNILLLTHSSTSLTTLLSVELLSNNRRNNILYYRLLLIQDGVWFDKFWTLQVVMNVPILVNYNFDILVTSPNELRAIHE